jgi:pimeloyl-ACP methyl ester carboxylesterase
MPRLAINGVDLYYEEHGRGAPLLLIAGLASDSQSWQPVVAGLAAHYRVILVDNRGVGRTTPLDARASIADMAADCITLVRHLRLESVYVVGHSMGGFIGQACAIRYPDRVAKLALAATASRSSARNNDLFAGWADALEAGADPGRWVRNLFYWIFSARFFDDAKAVADAVRFALEYPYPQPPEAFRNQVRAIAAFDSARELGRIRVPTLVMAGAEDLLFPVAVCERFARSIAQADSIVIDGAAHALHVEQPSVFTQQVLTFFAD